MLFVFWTSDIIRKLIYMFEKFISAVDKVVIAWFSDPR